MNAVKLGFIQVWSKKSRLIIQWIMVAVGMGLITGFYTFQESTDDQLVSDISSIDQVWCAKGSPLQGLLANVYHMDNPTGNISLAEVNKYAENPMVEKVTRISYGDVLKGRRILGADTSWRSLYNLELLSGQWNESPMEVVLSESLANELNLNIGDEFEGQHGDVVGGHTHEEHYHVVGIFAKTGNVADRVLLTSLESVWNVHHSESNNLEITAALVEASPMAFMQLPRLINSKSTFQAVLPSIEVNRIYALLGNTRAVLVFMSVLFLVLGGLSIGITVHETIRSQQYDYTLLRVFGLSPLRLAVVIWTQTFALILSAWLVGSAAVKLAMHSMRDTLSLEQGIQLQVELFGRIDLYEWLAAVGLALLLPLPTIVRIFRTTIHKNLKNA